jgi:hypothetical protein
MSRQLTTSIATHDVEVVDVPAAWAFDRQD